MECSTLHFLQRHLSFLSFVVVVVFIYHFPIFEGNLGRFKDDVIIILPFLLLFKLHKKDTKIPFHSPVCLARPHIKTHPRTTMRYYLTPLGWLLFKKKNNKCWQRYEETGTLVDCQWECKVSSTFIYPATQAKEGSKSHS